MKRPFRSIGWIGLALVMMSIVLLLVFPRKVGRLPDGFTTPILAFEFIETGDEVKALFDMPDSEARAAAIESMDLGNRLDFVYMFLYSSFLFFFSFRAFKRTGIRPLLGVMVLSLIILIGDALENVQLLAITQSLYSGDFGHELKLLPIFTWLKWGGLAFAFVLLIPYWITGRILEKVLSFLAVLVAAFAMAAFIFRSVLSEIFAVLVALMFVLMIVYCFLYKESEKTMSG